MNRNCQRLQVPKSYADRDGDDDYDDEWGLFLV